MDDIYSGKTKVSCLKYIVKNVTMSFHLTFFSILGVDFCHQNFGPLENKKFSFNKKILVIYNLHNISFVVLYILFTIKNFLWYICNWLIVFVENHSHSDLDIDHCGAIQRLMV